MEDEEEMYESDEDTGESDDEITELGREICSVDNVRAYLVKQHDIDEDEAEELCQNHIDIIEYGMEMKTSTYIVAQEIEDER